MTFRITFSGRVQGVGFRYHVFQIASQEGLRGQVKNLANGDVEVLLATDQEDLADAFIQTVQESGNSWMRIDSIQKEVMATSDHWDRFKITY